jgi:prepilin-type N-terminal cleavage/methylation domain-containing protein
LVQLLQFSSVDQFSYGGGYLDSLKKISGFTLIEVLVALIILSFSLLALAGLMVTTTKNNSFGSHLTEAATFAQDKLEELRALRWDNINEGANTDQKVSSTGIDYTRNWNVVTNGSLKTITITINWNDRTAHSIRVTSVLCQ